MSDRKDRRIEKTRSVIRETLLREMKGSSYQELSVSKLCREANIGRGTFYLHYNDIYEVVQEIEDKLLAEFRDMAFRHFDLGTSYSDFLHDLLIWVKDRHDEYEVLILPSESRFAYQFREAAIELFYYHAIKYQPKRDPSALKYRIIKEYAGISGVIDMWFHSNFAETPELLIKYLEA